MPAVIRNTQSRLSGQAGETFLEKGKQYRVVFNNEASTAMSNGDVVVYDGTLNDGYSVKLTTTANSLGFVGVVVDAIPAQSYGRVLVYGVHDAVKVVTTAGGATAGTTGIGTSATSGRAADTVTANAGFGVFLQTVAASTTTTAKAFIRGT